MASARDRRGQCPIRERRPRNWLGRGGLAQSIELAVVGRARRIGDGARDVGWNGRRSGQRRSASAPKAISARRCFVMEAPNPRRDVTPAAHWYLDAGAAHSFVRAADGTITTFDVLGGSSTKAVAINAKDVIFGSYSARDGTEHDFIRSLDGTITTFAESGCDVLRPASINRKGTVTGYCESDEHLGHETGFVRKPDGRIRKFHVPGGGTGMQPNGINDSGVIAGNCNFGGFLRFP